MLIFIYYFKGILSISDIQSLLTPLSKNFFQSPDDINTETVYREVFGMEEAQIESIKSDLLDKYQTAQNTFKDAPEDQQEFLHLFSFISLLSFDVYVKKQIIEKIIDSFPSD